MSDVIISRRGSSATSNTQLITAYFTTNTNFQVPENIKNNEIFVTMIGGGWNSYESYNNGGPSGFFNNGIISVIPGEVIPISVGKAGINNANGPGTTSFGTYLSANGARYNIGSAGGFAYVKSNNQKQDATHFGGGAGGNGGPWGGGGGAIWKSYNIVGVGHGGTYGGGGGSSFIFDTNRKNCLSSNAGNGGMYGGGGGASVIYVSESSGGGVMGTANNNVRGYTLNLTRYVYDSNAGTGGTYGGNGGAAYPYTNLGTMRNVASDFYSILNNQDIGWYYRYTNFNADEEYLNWNWSNITIDSVRNAEPGINTLIERNVDQDQFNIRLDGEGLAGNINVTEVSGSDLYSGGGGGGYGGNGGYGVYMNNILAKIRANIFNYFNPVTINYNTLTNNNNSLYSNTHATLSLFGISGGGGGGYGSNGGNGLAIIYNISRSDIYRIGGGGGGYGGDGADGINGGGGGGYGKQAIGRYGGGGYYCPGGGINKGRGGGGIGIWTSDGKVFIGSYGSGGSWYGFKDYDQDDSRYVSAEPGVCIVQYYI